MEEKFKAAQELQKQLEHELGQAMKRCRKFSEFHGPMQSTPLPVAESDLVGFVVRLSEDFKLMAMEVAYEMRNMLEEIRSVEQQLEHHRRARWQAAASATVSVVAVTASVICVVVAPPAAPELLALGTAARTLTIGSTVVHTASAAYHSTTAVIEVKNIQACTAALNELLRREELLTPLAVAAKEMAVQAKELAALIEALERDYMHHLQVTQASFDSEIQLAEMEAQLEAEMRQFEAERRAWAQAETKWLEAILACVCCPCARK